ncbi:hypothetical protein KEF85_14455 [Methylomonas paludis]|uniref:Uncharacterized protein n=1 Tax=Methylomonas paludis TaxID=1173101 RepID=A0A975MMW8_9GAMM|nr:hypothetical protein [Methylomonas paludis]QWF70515.1 hypothetical protein KEF85_14455 [Methylomonas paludis]
MTLITQFADTKKGSSRLPFGVIKTLTQQILLCTMAVSHPVHQSGSIGNTDTGFDLHQGSKMVPVTAPAMFAVVA